MKKELIKKIAESLASYGYKVYLSSSGKYGFYTDGKRLVSFGGQWNFCVDFSGRYNSTRDGSGWQIAPQKTSITKEEANEYIAATAPRWATTENVTYTTPEQHLKRYGKSSGYTEFEPLKG